MHLMISFEDLIAWNDDSKVRENAYGWVSVCVSMSECKRVCEHGCVCDGERERERMKKSSQVFSTQASKQKKILQCCQVYSVFELDAQIYAIKEEICK